MLRIGMFGECMIELNGEPFKSIKQSYGGDTLNSAIYLSRCIRDNQNSPQVQIDYITAVGNDLLSQQLVQRWEKEKINTQFVFKSSTRHCGLYFIQLDERGERSFQYWRNESAAKYFFSEFEQNGSISDLKKLNYLLLSGISLAILPIEDKPKLINLLRELKTAGVKIIFDGNFRPKLWSNYNQELIKQWYEHIYKLTDIALITEEDETAIWGETSHDKLVARLHDYGISIVVVKLGENGCLLSEQNTSKVYIATRLINQVVDTTSAGDSFNAGFLYYLLMNKSLEEACQFGNFVASIVIQHHGAIIDSDIKFIKTER